MIATTGIIIKEAAKTDASILTNIAFAAKRHWNYPEQYFEIWKNELTITSSYIEKNIVFNASYNHSIVGFYSIVEVESDMMAGEVLVRKGFWLEHIFVLPEFHKSGIGRILVDHAKMSAKKQRADTLWIFADPFARGFYDKMDAKYEYDTKSSIKDRMIPVYSLKI
jgi:GNAT superfamily N-acetyltransferase